MSKPLVQCPKCGGTKHFELVEHTLSYRPLEIHKDYIQVLPDENFGDADDDELIIRCKNETDNKLCGHHWPMNHQQKEHLTYD